MFQRKRWGGVGKAPRGFVCSFLLLIFVAASLLFPLSARAEGGQADLDGLAPYADDGDLDYIPDYFVTVDLREDGSAAMPRLKVKKDWFIAAVMTLPSPWSQARCQSGSR